MEEETKIQKAEVGDTIKLSKTSTNKFSWDIRLISKDHDATLKEIERIHLELLKKYPNR